MKKVLSFMVLVCIYFSGCSSAYYKTESAFGAKIDKSQPLAIITPENANVEESNFGRALGHLMAQSGYSIIGINTESKGKDTCGVFYSLDEPTYQNIGSYTTNNTTTSYTSGFVGGNYVSTRTNTTTPQTHTYTYYTTYKKIYVRIGCLNAQGKVDYLWNGFASAEIDDYRDNQENTIKNLIGLMQEEKFRGNVRISTDKNLEWVLKNQKRRNYLTISADAGYGFVDGMAEPVSLAPYGYSNHIIFDDVFYYSDTIPLTLRLGYLRDFNNKSWSLGINAIYTIGNIIVGVNPSNTYDGAWEYSCVFSSCSTKITDSRIGIEVVVTKNIKGFGIFAGIGITKGINSAINITIQDSSGTMQTITKKLDSLYPIWRLGTLYTIPTTNLSITWDIIWKLVA